MGGGQETTFLEGNETVITRLIKITSSLLLIEVTSRFTKKKEDITQSKHADQFLKSYDVA